MRLLFYKFVFGREFAREYPVSITKTTSLFVRHRSQFYAVYNAIPPPIVHAGKVYLCGKPPKLHTKHCRALPSDIRAPSFGRSFPRWVGNDLGLEARLVSLSS